MKAPFVKRLAPFATIAIVIGVVAVRRAATADSPRLAPAGGAGADNQAVRTVPPGTRLATHPRKRGDTYYWIEGQTVQSTIRFGDIVVVADRRGDGRLPAKAPDAAGNDRGDLTASSAVLQYRSASGDGIDAQNGPSHAIQEQSTQEQSTQEQSTQGQSTQRQSTQRQSSRGD